MPTQTNFSIQALLQFIKLRCRTIYNTAYSKLVSQTIYFSLKPLTNTKFTDKTQFNHPKFAQKKSSGMTQMSKWNQRNGTLASEQNGTEQDLRGAMVERDVVLVSTHTVLVKCASACH